MPIYEFKCSSCGQNFEKLCSMGESGKNIKCPACGTWGPKKMMSSFNAVGTSSGKGSSSCSTCSSHSCSSCGH